LLLLAFSAPPSLLAVLPPAGLIQARDHIFFLQNDLLQQKADIGRTEK
jgi:hypothetical protein